LPFGLAASGWVALAKGPNLFSAVPFIGPLLLVALGVFRVYLVARYPSTLSSPGVSGIAAVLRALGQAAIYIGVVATVLSWGARPLMRALMTSRTESGAEFFVVGLYLSLVAGIGMLGLLMFEFSRLLAFERLAYERHQRKEVSNHSFKRTPDGAA
jgi:hypothetical protein